jgi:hypothetical protein
MSHATRSAPSNQAELPRLESPTATETFVVNGCSYQWHEGAPSEADVSERARTARQFSKALVPHAEARGARGLVFDAASPNSVDGPEARWISWRVPGTAAPLWGLYASARRLATSFVAPVANDGFVLIAWGEGGVLVWVHDDAAARQLVRAAVRRPPPWLARGMTSRDDTFAARLTPAPTRGRRPRTMAPVAMARPTLAAGADAPAPSNVLLEMIQSWRKAHAKLP